jgi:hypothetical protein
MVEFTAFWWNAFAVLKEQTASTRTLIFDANRRIQTNVIRLAVIAGVF